MPEPLSAPAPAKINLILEVLGRRPDGHHEIDTILQTLELADTVTLIPGGSGVTIAGPFASGTPSDTTNLAARAIEAVRADGHASPPLGIHINKQVPAAGGLGGGASDAATTLRLLQRIIPSLTDADLLRAANAIGSDEAALLRGGTVRARGRGDAVTALPDLATHGIVLFVPPATITGKTARMFAELTKHPFDEGGIADAFSQRQPGDFAASDIFNAFERVAFDVFVGLAELQQGLEDLTDEPIRLAGAGPTLFWIGPESRAAAIVERTAGVPCAVITTRTARSLWRQ